MTNGLHADGLSSKRRIREFDALCRFDLEATPAGRICALHERIQLSQVVFAAVLNLSVSTVRQWESGDMRSGGVPLKLLALIGRKALEFVL